MQDEATKLIFEESEEGTTCNKECSLFEKGKHYHCRMVSLPHILSVDGL